MWQRLKLANNVTSPFEISVNLGATKSLSCWLKWINKAVPKNYWMKFVGDMMQWNIPKYRRRIFANIYECVFKKMKSNCPSLAYIPKNPIKEKLLYMLLLVDQYSSGTVSSQTIHMSRELFMLPQWHVKTHNITYSSQLIVYLDLELVENHFLLF